MESLSEEAKNVEKSFQDAVKSGDGELLSNLIFDADMEDDTLATQIDLQWYEKKASDLMQS